MTDSMGRGGGLAGRFAAVVGQGVVTTRQQLSGHERSMTALKLDDFFDKVSGEIRNTAGPIFAPLADHPDAPAQLKPLFNFLARGKGQWQTFLGQSVIGAAIGGGIVPLINNTLAPVTQRLIASQPHGILDPSTAAKAAATGLTNGLDMAYEAAKNGIPQAQFDALVELAKSRADVGIIIDALNKGVIDEDTARVMFTRIGMNSFDVGVILNSHHTEITPETAASLVTFGVINEDEGKAIAAKSGMRPDDFDKLVQGNGQPPSTQELLFAYRRGVIDKARLFRGITQGPLRNEWFDVVESFGQVPMSTADAIRAAIQGHLSQEQARAIAQQNGLIPDQFDPLMATAGEPPGPEKMLELLNRGEVTEAQVRQALSESRLKNTYIDLLIKGRYELPTQAQILSMVRNGTITKERGLTLLQQRGYLPDIAQTLIADVTRTKASTVKELSLTAIRDLYLDKAITADQATARIVALGYTHDDAVLELQLVDEQRSRRFTQAVITRIHREYTAGLLTSDEVHTYLGQLSVPPDQTNTYLELWDIEKATVRRSLTEAQVAQALKKGLIQADEAVSRWQAMGYSAGDAQLLLGIATPAAKTTGP